MRDAIIIDVDNCWMDSREWLSFAPYPSRIASEWKDFYRKVYLCKPNKRFIWDVLGLIEEINLYPIFVTSRSYEVRGDTIFQIENNSPLRVGESCLLYMRTKEHKYAKSYDVKHSILSSLKDDFNFVYGIDDDENNLRCFKDCGVSMVIKYDIETHDYERY